MNIAEKCGKRIQEIRADFNLSQEAFAKKAGISRNALSNYERGLRSPDIATLQAISNEFNLPIDYIIGTSDIKSYDEDINMICKVTGLSECSIQTLESMKDKPYFKILDKILECKYEDDFIELESILAKTLDRCKEVIKMKALSNSINYLADTKCFYDMYGDSDNSFIKKLLIDLQDEILSSCTTMKEKESISDYFNLTFDKHMMEFEKFCIQTDIMDLINSLILDYTSNDERNEAMEQFYLSALKKHPKVIKKYITLLQKEQQISNEKFDSLMNALGFNKKFF